MADVREIRERLENLAVIEHLIRSMRAMSAIRWRKARNSLEAVQRYAARVQDQLSAAVSYRTRLVRAAGSTVSAVTALRWWSLPQTTVCVGRSTRCCSTRPMCISTAGVVKARR
jgi:hypothetical protein